MEWGCKTLEHTDKENGRVVTPGSAQKPRGCGT